MPWHWWLWAVPFPKHPRKSSSVQNLLITAVENRTEGCSEGRSTKNIVNEFKNFQCSQLGSGEMANCRFSRTEFITPQGYNFKSLLYFFSLLKHTKHNRAHINIPEPQSFILQAFQMWPGRNNTSRTGLRNISPTRWQLPVPSTGARRQALPLITDLMKLYMASLLLSCVIASKG